MNTQRTSGGSVTEGLPKYELIDKDGKPFDGGTGFTLTFDTAHDAILMAARLWPDQEQDETRSGKGWDIEVVS